MGRLLVWVLFCLIALVGSTFVQYGRIGTNPFQSLRLVQLTSQSSGFNQLVRNQLRAMPLPLLNVNFQPAIVYGIPSQPYQSPAPIAYGGGYPMLYLSNTDQSNLFPVPEQDIPASGQTSMTSATMFAYGPPARPEVKTSAIYGSWNMTESGPYKTRVPINITNDKILFDYCNPHAYSYSILGNNIKIVGGSNKRGVCFYAPNQAKQDEIEAYLIFSYAWELSPTDLVLKDREGEIVAKFVKK